MSQKKDLHLEHGAEGDPAAHGGRGGPDPDHGATGAGTLRCQTKPANPDPERPTRRRACCKSYLVHFSHVSQQLEPEISLKLNQLKFLHSIFPLNSGSHK